MLRIIFALLFLAANVQASQPLNEIMAEKLYLEIKQNLQEGENQNQIKGRVKPEYFQHQQYSKVYLDVLWDMAEESQWRTKRDLRRAINHVNGAQLSQEERFRLFLIKKKLGLVNREDLKILDQFKKYIASGKASSRSVMLYLTQQELFFHSRESIQFLQTIYPAESKSYYKSQSFFRPKTPSQIQDLFYHSPVAQNYRGGRYENTPKLFMFCRHDRRYPCLMLMKDANGQEVYQDDGKLWHQPSLGLARRGVPFDQKNGYTPSGVYTLDSVMPSADQQKTFGEFRRVIMNFIPSSPNENLLKSFLPESSHDDPWWRESVVARDIGRNLLRLHGTGRKNRNPFAKHYPFIKTAGCIMAREGEYGSKTYNDQRLLLDQIMISAGLDPIYQNETSIIGLIYVIELDDKKNEVRYQDLMSYLKG